MFLSIKLKQKQQNMQQGMSMNTGQIQQGQMPMQQDAQMMNAPPQIMQHGGWMGGQGQPQPQQQQQMMNQNKPQNMYMGQPQQVQQQTTNQYMDMYPQQ